jgi:hypothetical protein
MTIEESKTFIGHLAHSFFDNKPAAVDYTDALVTTI